MRIPDIHWIRRHTTAEDLLDDGAENFSDLAALNNRPAPQDPPSPESLAVRQRTLEQIRKQQEQCELTARRRAISIFGLCLGVLIALSGAALLAFPVDMLIQHTRIKYLPSFVEHVTPARSVLYGAALLLAGACLAGYALYRPRTR